MQKNYGQRDIFANNAYNPISKYSRLYSNMYNTPSIKLNQFKNASFISISFKILRLKFSVPIGIEYPLAAR